jgi:uncharacterized membrane protein YhaH (DUF805 family)
MKPFTWVTLVLVTIMALVAMFQIPLVQDTVTASGFSSAEVESGIAGVLLVFYSVLAVFEVRS